MVLLVVIAGLAAAVLLLALVRYTKLVGDPWVKAADRLQFWAMEQQNAVMTGRFLKNESGGINIGGMIMLIVGGVIIFKFAGNILPTAASDYATAYGTGSTLDANTNVSDSDISTARIGTTLILLFGVIIVVAVIMKALRS